ncbi:MAG: hypothetical protein AB7I18_01760 [Candidatus Berkiella sp.]
MKQLSHYELNLVAGGVCAELYEADIPLPYLPIVAKHLKLLNKHKFDSELMLTELSDAGLDISQVNVKVGVQCYPK